MDKPSPDWQIVYFSLIGKAPILVDDFEFTKAANQLIASKPEVYSWLSRIETGLQFSLVAKSDPSQVGRIVSIFVDLSRKLPSSIFLMRLSSKDNLSCPLRNFDSVDDPDSLAYVPFWVKDGGLYIQVSDFHLFVEREMGDDDRLSLDEFVCDIGLILKNWPEIIMINTKMALRLGLANQMSRGNVIPIKVCPRIRSRPIE